MIVHLPTPLAGAGSVTIAKHISQRSFIVSALQTAPAHPRTVGSDQLLPSSTSFRDLTGIHDDFAPDRAPSRLAGSLGFSLIADSRSVSSQWRTVTTGGKRRKAGLRAASAPTPGLRDRSAKCGMGLISIICFLGEPSVSHPACRLHASARACTCGESQ